MKQFQTELDLIKKILKSSPHGMSVTEIARTLNKNQHSVGRYLDILLVSGHVEMRMYGKAKVYSLSSRIPLNTIMGGMHDLILVLDSENRIVQINDQFLQLLKKARKDLLNKNISYIPLDNPAAEAVFSSIRVSLDTEQPDKEIELDKGDGRVYRQKIIPTVFEDGGSGTIVLLENITERKSAELALRASEEQFRLMAENIHDGIVIYRNRKLAYMNRRVEEIAGYSKEELVRLSPLEIAAPEDRERMGRELDHYSTEDQIPSEVPFWLIRKDGTRRFVSCRITSLQQDDGMVLYIVITDMTEWKHVQDALENQLIFLQHMIDTFPNPLFYFDTHGRYLGCNSSFTSMTGKTLKDIAGKTDPEISGTWEHGLFDRFNTDLVKGPGIRNYTGSFHHLGGTVSDISIQKSTVTTVEGTPAGIVGIVLASRDSSKPGCP